MASNPDKDCFYISDVDDRDYLAAFIKATIPALPKPKAKKNPRGRLPVALQSGSCSYICSRPGGAFHQDR